MVFISRLKITFWKVTNSRQGRSISVKSLFERTDIRVEFDYCGLRQKSFSTI